MIQNMAFSPANGLKDASYSQTTPSSEAEIRAEIQGVSDQLRDFINNSVLSILHSITLGSSGSEEIASPTIAGITGNNVYTQIANLLSIAQAAQAGTILPGTVTDSMLSNADGMTKAQLVDINTKLNNYNSYASAIDSNGIYTVLSYKRTDGTLYMKSTLSGGTSPSYTTDTWQFYDATGSTVISTKTWTITYDANGKITSKVVA